jgi:transcriptional regulator with XRE-family HTH domain
MAHQTRTRGDQLIRRRLARGWTQKDLAHHAGVSQPVISRMQSGLVSGTPSTIGKVARALGCHPDDIIDFDNDGPRADVCSRCGTINPLSHINTSKPTTKH